MDMSSFELAIIGMRFGLARYLGGQPLQIMGKVGAEPHSKDYLFNVEMWHEALLQDRHATGSDATSDSDASAVPPTGSAAVPPIPPPPPPTPASTLVTPQRRTQSVTHANAVNPTFLPCVTPPSGDDSAPDAAISVLEGSTLDLGAHACMASTGSSTAESGGPTVDEARIRTPSEATEGSEEDDGYETAEETSNSFAIGELDLMGIAGSSGSRFVERRLSRDARESRDRLESGSPGTPPAKTPTKPPSSNWSLRSTPKRGQFDRMLDAVEITPQATPPEITPPVDAREIRNVLESPRSTDRAPPSQLRRPSKLGRSGSSSGRPPSWGSSLHRGLDRGLGMLRVAASTCRKWVGMVSRTCTRARTTHSWPQPFTPRRSGADSPRRRSEYPRSPLFSGHEPPSASAGAATSGTRLPGAMPGSKGSSESLPVTPEGSSLSSSGLRNGTPGRGRKDSRLGLLQGAEAAASRGPSNPAEDLAHGSYGLESLLEPSGEDGYSAVYEPQLGRSGSNSNVALLPASS